ncbi:MAG: sulfurtransferase [Gammaproteobacteria bacterium]|nr:sulfurtransferase [Gammaproteobacteria bacterium]
MSLLLNADQLANSPDDGKLVIVDCRFNLLAPEAGRDMWQEAHIPGAFYADLDKDLAGPVTATSGRHPLPDPEGFSRLLGSWGVRPDTTVVAYDDVGGAVAARLWWLLRWVGHPHVGLLNGGWQAWLASGLPTDSNIPELLSACYPVIPGSMPTISVDEVQQGLGSGELTLLDARDTKRFAGKSEPIDTRAGHIPGAWNRPFQANLAKDKQFLSTDKLCREFDALITAQRATQLASMCGSGVTACHNLFAMELAGITSDSGAPAALYVGSWSEWLRSPDRPCEPAD